MITGQDSVLSDRNCTKVQYGTRCSYLRISDLWNRKDEVGNIRTSVACRVLHCALSTYDRSPRFNSAPPFFTDTIWKWPMHENGICHWSSGYKGSFPLIGFLPYCECFAHHYTYIRMLHMKINGTAAVPIQLYYTIEYILQVWYNINAWTCAQCTFIMYKIYLWKIVPAQYKLWRLMYTVMHMGTAYCTVYNSKLMV